MDFREEDYRDKVPFSSQHIKGIYQLHDLCLLILTLITWLVVLLGCILPICGILIMLWALQGTFNQLH